MRNAAPTLTTAVPNAAAVNLVHIGNDGTVLIMMMTEILNVHKGSTTNPRHMGAA